MSRRPQDYVVLLTTAQSAWVHRIEELLAEDAIPYHMGVVVGRPPQAVFSVPRSRLDDARVTIASELPFHFFDEQEDDEPAPQPVAPARFPWRPFWTAVALAAFHLAIVVALWVLGPEARRSVFAVAGLRPELAGFEPWRLVTSLFLHSDIPHVGWNALSMIVFAVALITAIGYRKTAQIYLLSGIGGGLAAAMFTASGITVLGSSGAVSGLFGAWVSIQVMATVPQRVGRHARLRGIGIGLLILPSLLTPTSADGGRISVSSHVGGIVAGLILGWLLTRGPDEGTKAPSGKTISFRRTD